MDYQHYQNQIAVNDGYTIFIWDTRRLTPLQKEIESAHPDWLIDNPSQTFMLIKAQVQQLQTIHTIFFMFMLLMSLALTGLFVWHLNKRNSEQWCTCYLAGVPRKTVRTLLCLPDLGAFIILSIGLLCFQAKAIAFGWISLLLLQAQLISQWQYHRFQPMQQLRQKF